MISTYQELCSGCWEVYLPAEQKADFQCRFDPAFHSLFSHTWLFGKYCVTAGRRGVDGNSLFHCEEVLCLISFPQFRWSCSVLEISITVAPSPCFLGLELYCQFSKSLGFVLTSGTSGVKCHFMVWAQMRLETHEIEEEEREWGDNDKPV